MWSLLKRHMAELQQAPPGERFRARYRARSARERESRLATAIYLSAGTVAVLLGIVFAFSPVVPGFVFVLAGLALLSARLGWLAHRLDRIELACRRRIPPGWLRRRHRSPPGQPRTDASPEHTSVAGAAGEDAPARRHTGRGAG